MSDLVPESTALPTVDNPQTKKKVSPKKKRTKKAAAQKVEEANAITRSLQQLSGFGADAFDTAIGLIANIASYGSVEKVDYDKRGKQITSGISKQKRRFRSLENMSEEGQIRTAIKNQKRELEEAAAKSTEWPDFKGEMFDTLMFTINAANDELQSRVFGPMWDNWTTADDFFDSLRETLGTIIDTFDPLMDAVNELQEYFYGKVSNVFDDMNVHVGTSRRGQSLDLPLGIVALQALNYLIDFLKEIIQNVEMLAEEYSSEELKVLLDKSTHTSNWSTFKQMIADLIQLIIDCIRPYIQNIIVALILDAVDLIVDALDKAGILSPKGPLKLIPVAITVVRSIMTGNLEAIEEMVRKTLTKLANMVYLARIARKDPSILWADTDRMDKEINIARYKDLMSDGKWDRNDRKAFLNGSYEEENCSASVRHFLQKVKNENSSWVDTCAEKAANWSNLIYWTNLAKDALSNKEENEATTQAVLDQAAVDMQQMEKSIASGVEEPEQK